MAHARPAGRRDAVHAGRRDEPGLAGRGDRPAERRGAVPASRWPRSSGRARRWSTARSPRTSTCGPARRRSGRRSTSRRVRERPDGAPLRPAVAVVERDGVERRRRPGRLRVRDGRVGRGHGRRQPAVPGRRLARGRADRVVREADRRRRDPPDDGRGPPAARASTRRASASTRSPTVGPGGHFFGTAAHPRALRDRVLPAAACRTGATSRRGRRTARGPRPSGRTRSGSGSSPSPSRRRMDAATAEELDAFVARRKREIGAAG